MRKLPCRNHPCFARVHYFNRTDRKDCHVAILNWVFKLKTIGYIHGPSPDVSSDAPAAARLFRPGITPAWVTGSCPRSDTVYHVSSQITIYSPPRRRRAGPARCGPQAAAAARVVWAFTGLVREQDRQRPRICTDDDVANSTVTMP
jgi:hypothetical protein